MIFATDESVVESQFAQMSSATAQALTQAQARLFEDLASAGLHFEGKSYPVSIRPLLLEAATVQWLARAAEQLSPIFDFAARLYVEDAEVRKLFPAYRSVEHLIVRLPKHSPLIRVYRLDGLFDETDSFRILETNTEAPGGVIQNGLAARIWSNVPNPLVRNVPHDALFQPFAVNPDLILQEIIDTHRERVGTLPERAAVVTFRGLFKNEVVRMVEGLNRLGVSAETLDASELRRGGKSLVDRHGRRVDVVYNKLDVRDLIDAPEVSDYLQAIADGVVTSINPLVGQWPLSDKAILALLSDPRTLARFSSEQQAFCRAHIPWTRVLREDTTVSPDGHRIDLLQYVSSHRSALVLKPSNATRGEGLTLGPFTPQSQWDATIATAMASEQPYVVQQYIQGRKVSAVHPADGVVTSLWSGVDAYVYGGKFAGFQARASFDPVMNVGKRGILLPVIVRKG
ncbi:hypothetical protein LZC95_50800 [Pendulispora brunnea]|uniref:Glutathione synthase n=1 Tax=Pendulispora brunnea TaxID=2905690 RepID=A0ABZ2K7N1_9BACT